MRDSPLRLPFTTLCAAPGLDSDSLADYLYNLVVLCSEAPENELVVLPAVPSRSAGPSSGLPSSGSQPLPGQTTVYTPGPGLPRPPASLSRFSPGPLGLGAPQLQRPSPGPRGPTAAGPRYGQGARPDAVPPSNPLLRSVSDPLRLLGALEERELAGGVDWGAGAGGGAPYYGGDGGATDLSSIAAAIAKSERDRAAPVAAAVPSGGLMKTVSAPEHQLRRMASPGPDLGPVGPFSPWG